MTMIAGAGFSTVSKDGHVGSIEADLRFHSEIGAEFTEICAYSIDLVAGGRLIAERVKELKSLTKAYPLKYSVHGLVSSNFMNSATLQRQKDVAKAYIEICDQIGSQILVHHSGFVSSQHPWDRADADQREFDALAEIGDYAARYGVRIALENIFTAELGQYRKAPSEVAATVRSLNHKNIVALIDFSHAYIESTYRGLNFLDELRALAPVAGHLHVHDSFGQLAGSSPFYYAQEGSALGLGDLHLPLGWGDIPWDTIFDELTFLPGTILNMEIGARFRKEQPQSLERARGFIERLNGRADKAA